MILLGPAGKGVVYKTEVEPFVSANVPVRPEMLTDPVGVGFPEGPLTVTPTGKGPGTEDVGRVSVIVGVVVPVEFTCTEALAVEPP